MRIVFIGQAQFGADTLATLIAQGEQIVGAITTPDHPRHPAANPVKQTAEQHGIPLFQTTLLKQPEAISWVRELCPDLLVLAFVTSFVPEDMIKLARLGGINYHPSLLPKYRGGSAINWAVINGEVETGVTIHYIDKGVDTGPIILQQTVPITPDDTVKSLYFNKLYPLGITMIREAVRLIRTGAAKAIPQEEASASFQPVITADDTVIDWHQSTATVYNLIRGSNPSPGAASWLRGERWLFFDCSSGSISGVPGTVVSVDDASFTVATQDGSITINSVRPGDGKKVSAAEVILAGSLKVGDRFEQASADRQGGASC